MQKLLNNILCFLNQNTRRSWLWWILTIALILRLAAVLVIDKNTGIVHEYMTIAQNLLDGNGYSWNEYGRMPIQPTSIVPPLYVYWCLIFQSFLGFDYTIMYLAQAFISALGVFLAYSVGRRMFDPFVGLCFAGLYAIYPEFVFMPTKPVTEFLYLLFSLALVLGYLRLKKSELDHHVRWYALGWGVVCGASVLVKESSILLIAGLGLSLLWNRRSEWRRVILRVGIPALLTMLMVILPWSVRNTLVQGEFILLRTGAGMNAWLGNHPGATGTDKTLESKPMFAALDSTYNAYMNNLLPTDEQDRDRAYLAEAKLFVRKNPGEYIALTLTRLRYFILFDETHPLSKSLVYRVSWISLLITGIAGGILAYRKRILDPAIFLSSSLIAILYIPLYYLPRFRLVPTMWLVLLSSLMVAELCRRYFPRFRSTIES